VDSTNFQFAGYCESDREPHLITIQKSWWENVPDRDRERLLFHELGHCVLKRSHKNGLTDGREFLSIMQGNGTQSPFYQDRNQFVNYSGFRKSYYVDELFDDNTSRPLWDNIRVKYDDLDTLDRENLFYDDFTDNQNNWFVDSTDLHQGKIENGFYTFLSNSSRFFPSQQISIDPARNFQIEIRLKNNQRGAYLFFGSDENGESQYFSYQDNLGFGPNGYIRDGNKYGYIFRSSSDVEPFVHQYALKPLRDFSMEEFVLMSIRREGDRLYYFINEKLFYVNDFYPFTGDRIAFIPNGSGDGLEEKELILDYLKVDYIP